VASQRLAVRRYCRGVCRGVFAAVVSRSVSRLSMNPAGRMNVVGDIDAPLIGGQFIESVRGCVMQGHVVLEGIFKQRDVAAFVEIHVARQRLLGGWNKRCSAWLA